MKASDARPDLSALALPARDQAGQPTMGPDDVVAIVRRHLDLEKVRSSDYDRELWQLWREEVHGAAASDHNGDVLERVLARVREGQ